MPRDKDGPGDRLVDEALLRRWPLPSPRGSKDDRGRVVLIGGSVRNPGGALLAASAALRAGAGKVQVVTVAPCAIAMAVAMPEALVHGCPATSDGDLGPESVEVAAGYVKDADAVVVGPGILQAAAASPLLDGIRDLIGGVLVLDALALPWLSDHLDGLDDLAGRLVLTPNLQELALTLGCAEPKKQAVAGRVRELAARCDGVVASGASTTWLSDRGAPPWRVQAGGPALGTAGSGDVKAGLVAGLCARGAEPFRATAWATLLHGRAGDALAQRLGPVGLLASEIAPEVPRLMATIGADTTE